MHSFLFSFIVVGSDFDRDRHPIYLYYYNVIQKYFKPMNRNEIKSKTKASMLFGYSPASESNDNDSDVNGDDDEGHETIKAMQMIKVMVMI